MESTTRRVVAFIEVSAQMGGVQFSTLYLAQRLDSSQYRAIVICPEEGALTELLRSSNVDVRIVPQPKLYTSSVRAFGKHVPNVLAWIANTLLILIIAYRLSAVLKELGADIVCTKGLYAHFFGGIASRFAKVACVWHVQDYVSDKLGVFFPMVFGLGARVLADRVIADGSPIKLQLSPYYNPTNIDLIFNGVDTDLFTPLVDGNSVRAEWEASDEHTLIGNVARLTPWKGQDYLVEAYAHIADSFPQTKLVLIGSPVFDNDEFELRLREKVALMGLSNKVIFAGYRWDLPHVLAAIDIYVHSSIEKDTSPLAVVSALAAGKPIILTNVPGVAELFQANVNGIIVQAKDAQELGSALAKCISDQALCKSLAHNARQFALEQLSIEKYVRNCETSFRVLLAPTSEV